MRSRRSFLTMAGLAASALFAGRAWGEEAPTACQDPATLSLSQRNRRRALGYASPSADPQKRCGLCTFFTGTGAACGTCQILSGGTVEAKAVCTSFARRG